MTPLDPTSERGKPNAVSMPAPAVTPTPDSALGLRLRIWLGCLGGALISALAFWWVAGTQLTLDADPARLLGWFAGVGGLGLAAGVGLALWLDHGVVTHLRGLTRGLASGRVQELRGLPSASGWGELSELTEWAQVLITRQRLSHRATAELEQLEAALAQVMASLERWRRTDRWEALPPLPGSGEALAHELNQTFARTAELGEQNLEAASRVREQILGVAGEARDSAGQAERGFVEATALLTTVRELQRLGSELRQAMATQAHVIPPVAATPTVAPAVASAPESAAAPVHAERLALYRDAVRSALEELIVSSNQSVEQLGGALRRVHEIAGQVQLVSQRATLVALHAVTLESRLPREERRGEELSDELRQLTADVRAAAQHADQLTAEVDRETRAAADRMSALRERVAPRLDLPDAPEDASVAAGPQVAPVPVAASAGVAPFADETIARLLDRVREMVQDATRKAERLSASGERASRTAERLVRRLEEEAREIEGLMVRLAPAQDATAGEPAGEGAADLHLLEGDEATAGEELAENDAAEPDPQVIAREERP